MTSGAGVYSRMHDPWISCNVVNAAAGVRLENTSTWKGHENCLFLHSDSLFSDIPWRQIRKQLRRKVKEQPLECFQPPSLPSVAFRQLVRVARRDTPILIRADVAVRRISKNCPLDPF